jgi:urease gamma subunit
MRFYAPHITPSMHVRNVSSCAAVVVVVAASLITSLIHAMIQAYGRHGRQCSTAIKNLAVRRCESVSRIVAEMLSCFECIRRLCSDGTKVVAICAPCMCTSLATCSESVCILTANKIANVLDSFDDPVNPKHVCVCVCVC